MMSATRSQTTYLSLGSSQDKDFGDKRHRRRDRARRVIIFREAPPASLHHALIPAFQNTIVGQINERHHHALTHHKSEDDDD